MIIQSASEADLEIAELEEFCARESLVDFVPMFSPRYQMGWVHRRICRKYQRFVDRVIAKQSPRLMYFIPPQRGKSQIVSRCAPAWFLGNHPDRHFIHASYGQRLADDFGRDVRGIMNRQRYHNVFPDTRIGVYGSEEGGAEQVSKITLSAGGSYKAVGVGVGTTGNPADIFSIDDPVKDQKSAESEIKPEDVIKWYTTVAQTRLAPGGGVVLTMTRWRMNDLAGLLKDVIAETGEEWDIIVHPAIATEDEYDDETKELLRRKGEVLHPERHTLKEVLMVRKTMLALGQGREWSSLYQQNPTPDDGIFYRSSDFRTYKSVPQHLNRYITTDLALGKKTTNDWTLILPAGVDPNDDLYMLPQMIRKRMDALETACRLLVMANELDAQVITLPNDHMGKTMLPFLEKLMEGATGDDAVVIGEEEFEIPRRWYTIEMMPVVEDKMARSAPFQARQRMGKVFWPEGPVFEEIVRPEFLAFPAGKNDDICDAAADQGRLLQLLDRARVPKVTKPKHVEPKRWKELDRRSKTKESPIKPLFGDANGKSTPHLFGR